ncbi:MAG: sulfite oxidase, partial [Pseudonocardiales bacterium]|nr:sulfite oxidase [Pseudonocardiales bacterium]
LDRITLAAQASDNYFQATAYRLLPAEADPTTAGHGDGISLGPIALNSEILSPDDGATVPAGTTHVTGYALAGEDRGVARVDVSLDNGRTWIKAELDPPMGRWTRRLWHAELDPPPGRTTLTARAWDTTAATQPESAAALWNPQGYVNNAWAHITVTAT